MKKQLDDITMRQFLFSQPNGEVEQPSDKTYLKLANRLLHHWDKAGLLQEVEDDLKKVVCISLIGYYQDVVSDAGVWRSFIDLCKEMYGHYVPFHNDDADYIVYELNRADVEFVVWYQLAFNSMNFRYQSPLSPAILHLADELYKILEDEYDDIVDPHDYKALFDCELHDEESMETLYDLGQWLFWKNWLMVPPFQLTYAQIYSQMVEIQHTAPTAEAASKQIQEMRDEIITSLPTGPLALYLREWLSVIIDGKMPKKKEPALNEQKGDHPWYTAFVKANNGNVIRFIKTYQELNDFFINALGWESGEEHLPSFKNHSDFVLMVTPDKGLMVAKNIARCIKHPENALYDEEHAKKFAFNLLSQRAVCPGDMLRYICKNGWLPDAHYPEEVSGTAEIACNRACSPELVAENWDFIARVYLQEFYRGD